MRIAAFTMTHNESIHLPLWIKYYGGQLGLDHVYVLDDGSTDNSAEGLDCDVIHMKRKPYHPGHQTAKNVAFQLFLLHMYDVVIYADADEMLVPDPDKYQDLVDYCRRMGRRYVRAFGFDVVHDYRKEPALDLSKPIVGQRRHWCYSEFLCKPLITRVPLRWTVGCHGARENVELDPDLYLFHLRDMDYDLYCQKMAYTRSMAWDEAALEGELAYHQRFSEEQIEAHFGQILNSYTESCDPGRYSVFSGGDLRAGPLIPIPARFFGIF